MATLGGGRGRGVGGSPARGRPSQGAMGVQGIAFFYCVAQEYSKGKITPMLSSGCTQ